MSNITTEQKELKQLTDIVHSFTFNSKVSNIVDDYLFNEETVMSGLKRKMKLRILLVQRKVKRD